MLKLRRVLLAGALAVLASLAIASSAAAAPGNGAQIIEESDCSTDAFGTSCYDVRGLFNLTETPSGNISSHASGDQSVKVTGAGPFEGCNRSASSRFNFHVLVKDGEVHEEGNGTRGKFSFECLGQNQSCTLSNQFHFANGEVQFSRPELNCTQP